MTITRQYLKDYKKPDYSVKHFNLYFNLEPQKTLVKSKMLMSQETKAPLVLNGENIKLISVKIDDKTLSNSDYTITETTLTIPSTPAQFQLEMTVEINPEENKSCEGLYFAKGLFSTQCEAESFQKITYFLDRPDVMTVYTVEIEADEKLYPQLLSNGNCLEKKSLGNGRHYAKWHDPFKKPCYLFALVAGDMGMISDSFTTKSGRKVALEIYAPHGKEARCQYAMTALKDSMKWDEDRFGLEYDLDRFMIVSNDDFNMGAMENKGLNIFNSRLILADEKTATDNDFHMVQSVIGHEYFHNWTGNRVTCRNWFELSLKEGLTVYRDQEFSSDLNSRSVQRMKDVDSLRTRQFSEDAGPNAHPVRPESCLAVDNFYTATIYEKGAEVIRMMSNLVGTVGFRKGMDEYFKRHDGQAVTINEFAAAISEANGQDFTQFKLWYSQAGTPSVTVKESYDLTEQTYTLELSQECELTVKEKEEGKTEKLPFVIPLKFGLLSPEGKEYPTAESMIVLNERSQKWTFKNIPQKPILSLNREFTSPIKLKWNVPHSDLIHLMKFDTDGFNRREACSQLLMTEFFRLIKAYTESKKAQPNSEIIHALGAILNDVTIDPEFKALILSMPSDQMIAQEEKTLNGNAFWNVELEFVKAFVGQFTSKIEEMYHKHHKLNTSGDRSLKNLMLRYLVMFNPSQYSSLAYAQFSQAKNMTEEVSALNSLSLMNAPDFGKASSEFYKRWKDDSVVFNKWLSAQALTKEGDALANVMKVAQDPAFDGKNPNNLYSLHRVLTGNLKHFYTDNPKVYQWFCSEIERVDSFNPQVASRLAQGFNFNQKLPANIKSLADTEIRKLLSNPKLSKNTRELLEKL